ncbi:MAG: DUF2946 family protein [Phycisphaerales bacterium]
MAVWALLAQLLIPALQGWHIAQEHAGRDAPRREHLHGHSCGTTHASDSGLQVSTRHNHSAPHDDPHDHDSCPTCVTLALSRQTPVVPHPTLAPALAQAPVRFVAAPISAPESGVDPTPRSSRGPPRAA